MADKIRLLPEVVANQIAAGEVVNRPASVVKEMMENAIDAGATSVKVNFRDGGKDLIQIVDDGCGMSPIDARMAFDRHATSIFRCPKEIASDETDNQKRQGREKVQLGAIRFTKVHGRGAFPQR